MKQILSLTFKDRTFNLEVESYEIEFHYIVYNLIYTSETDELQDYLSADYNNWHGLSWSTNPILWELFGGRWFLTLSSNTHFELFPTKSSAEGFPEEDTN